MNYKRKSRRRFFLLVRSRSSPISSEFRGRGGGLNTPAPPRYATVAMCSDTLTRRVSRILRVKPADLRPLSLVEAHGKVFYVFSMICRDAVICSFSSGMKNYRIYVCVQQLATLVSRCTQGQGSAWFSTFASNCTCCITVFCWRRPFLSVEECLKRYRLFNC